VSAFFWLVWFGRLFEHQVQAIDPNGDLVDFSLRSVAEFCTVAINASLVGRSAAVGLDFGTGFLVVQSPLL
jgi:hypothetical protein